MEIPFDYETKFRELVHSDCLLASTVKHAKALGLGPYDQLRIACIVLSENRSKLLADLMELQGIVPQRIQAANGEVYRYDAPDSLVPLITFPGFKTK